MPLAPVIEAAADGALPAWSQASPRRLDHMQRVAALLDEWAAALELAPDDRKRWRAAGILHDALRETRADELRALVSESLRTLPGKLLHGPAAAARLREDGITDEPLLHAIAFHTIGHPALDTLGQALFIADYIEPGRRYEPAQLAVLRARMPHALGAVLREVLRARLGRLVTEGRPIRPETAAFWNAVTTTP